MNKATGELTGKIKSLWNKEEADLAGQETDVWLDRKIFRTLKLLKDMGYKREVEKKLPIRFLHPDDKPNTSYETAKQDMLKWHNASLEEIDIE